MNQMEFVDVIMATGRKLGFPVDTNRNGDRQITFDYKNLGRPCAAAPFFDLAVKAGLCQEVIDGRRKFYKFEFGSKAAAPAA